jgi:type IV pilus assembly protein PilM
MSHKAFYSKLFAPPRFLEMSAVAVEILQTGVYFLTTKATGRGLLPDKNGFIPLAPGDVVHGEIVRREPVIKALFEIKKRTGATFVRFSVPEEKTYIFKTHLPDLKPEEVRDVLDFKLEENIPLSAKEAVFDYDIMPAKKHNSGLDVIVAAAPLKAIEDLQSVFQSAGLIPALFGPESNNVAKAVVRSNNEQVMVVVNIREANVILSWVVNGAVYQTSSVNFGSSTFTEQIAKYCKVSLEEAVKIKTEKLYRESQESTELFSQIINTVSAIKDEVYKFIAYCNDKGEVTNGVDRVIVCGQDAMIVGLTRYLSSNLNLPVETANVWANHFSFDDYIPELSQTESLNYAVVSGLSLY